MPMLALFGVAALVLAGPGPAEGTARPWPVAQDESALALVARDDGQRLRAVLDLALSDTPTATASLVSALRDRDAGVRLTAGRLLARRGARAATTAATAWLAAPAPNERLLGLLVLRDVAELPDEARRAVERSLRNGDVTARLQGLEILAAHPATSSFGAVVALLDDEIAEVRVRALRALAAMRDARASLAVTRRLGDSDRGVRMEAATTLGALGDRRVVPALLRQLDARSPEPRSGVVEALGRLGDAAALPTLTRLAGRSPRDDLARHATLALGALGTPDAVEALLALARQPPGADDVRVALERVGTGVVPRLCREVTSGSPTSARLAVEALGHLGDRRATGVLVGAVERDAEVRTSALEALARLADPAALPALARAATDAEVPEVRLLALDALAATGDERSLFAASRALGDAAPGVRARAARVAGALAANGEGGRDVGAALAARLEDADAAVRSEAALALARLPALPGGLAATIAAALARATFSAPARAALGDVLERAAGAPDGPALARAYVTTPAATARAVLARGLVGAFSGPSVGAPLDDGTLVAALLRDVGEDGEDGDVGEDGAVALPAAEALAAARLSRSAVQALTHRYARAEEAVRARLAPALAQDAAGRIALAATLRDVTASPSVRAAAAWALASAPDARATLVEAGASSEAAVSANARAALAVAGRASNHAPSHWSSIELTSPAGEPIAGRWVTVSVAEGPTVWVMTDPRGRARIAGLPAGTLTLRLAPR